MKIKAKTAFYCDAGLISRGQEADLEDTLAMKLIAAGHADAVREEFKKEAKKTTKKKA